MHQVYTVPVIEQADLLINISNQFNEYSNQFVLLKISLLIH